MAFPTLQHLTDSYRKRTEDLIAMYKHEPCLWHTNNRDYYDKSKRNSALNRILEKCRQVEPAIGREDVSRRINSLQTTYIKERQKMKEAEEAGVGRVPRVWYYKLMTFLDDKDRPAVPGARAHLDADDTEEIAIKEDYVDEDDDVKNITVSIDLSDTEDPISAVPTPRTKKRKVEYKHSTAQLRDGGSRPGAGHKRFRGGGSGRHGCFGKYISCKLRGLPRQQLFLAEKLINEVLFEAECSNLTMKHKLAKE